MSNFVRDPGGFIFSATDIYADGLTEQAYLQALRTDYNRIYDANDVSTLNQSDVLTQTYKDYLGTLSGGQGNFQIGLGAPIYEALLDMGSINGDGVDRQTGSPAFPEHSCALIVGATDVNRQTGFCADVAHEYRIQQIPTWCP